MKKNKIIRRFMHRPQAVIGLCILVLEILFMCFAPVFIDIDPNHVNTAAFFAAPSDEYLLGADGSGRDIFARLIYGGRNTLFIGIASTFVSILVGLPLGLFAGYYRGRVEGLIMRSADVFQSFPTLVLGLVIAAVLGPSIPLLIFMIGFFGWPSIAKLIYGNVLSVRSKEYVEAERAIGANDLQLLFGTVLPNSIAPLWVALSFRVSTAMLTESSLSFLGVGVKPPAASWGNIIQEASSLVVLTTRWWIWVPAGLCLIVTVICLNFVGEGLRDALDPKMQRM